MIQENQIFFSDEKFCFVSFESLIFSLKFLVYKYKKDSDVTFGDKLAKLSLHSIKKKSSRIKERFSVNFGFIDQTRDQNFNREETRYRKVEKSVAVFVRDVQIYIEEVQVTDVLNHFMNKSFFCLLNFV